MIVMQLMEEKDSLTLDVFFLIVAHWAGIGDSDKDEGDNYGWLTAAPETGGLLEVSAESNCSDYREGAFTDDNLDNEHGKCGSA